MCASDLSSYDVSWCVSSRAGFIDSCTDRCAGEVDQLIESHPSLGSFIFFAGDETCLTSWFDVGTFGVPGSFGGAISTWICSCCRLHGEILGIVPFKGFYIRPTELGHAFRFVYDNQPHIICPGPWFFGCVAPDQSRIWIGHVFR